MGREDKVDPRGARELRDPLDRRLHVTRRDHHQISKLVNDHQKIRVGAQHPVKTRLGQDLARLDRLIEVVNMFEPVIG